MSFIKHSRSDYIETITISRPDKLNALSPELLQELTGVFRSLLEQPEPPRCAILTGEGKAFVAGADIAAMANLLPTEARRFAELGHRLGSMFEEAPFPIIAAVNGFALGGGCELALACDFIFAADSAKFGQPEVKLGIIPGFGGTQRLARRVGMGKARELVYTGDVIAAAEALRIGLVNAVFPGAELMAQCEATAKKICSMGPLAVAAAKRVMLRGEDQSLPAANELEVTAFSALFTSADQREGMTAFVEKRAAAFKGS